MTLINSEIQVGGLNYPVPESIRKEVMAIIAPYAAKAAPVVYAPTKSETSEPPEAPIQPPEVTEDFVDTDAAASAVDPAVDVDSDSGTRGTPDDSPATTAERADDTP